MGIRKLLFRIPVAFLNEALLKCFAFKNEPAVDAIMQRVRTTNTVLTHSTLARAMLRWPAAFHLLPLPSKLDILVTKPSANLLTHAASSTNQAVTQVLLQAGANPNAVMGRFMPERERA